MKFRWDVAGVVLISLAVVLGIFVVAFFAVFGAMTYYKLGQLGVL